MAAPMQAGVIGVTGATGHLGQWVTAELISRGFEVVSLSRRPDTYDRIKDLNGFGDCRRVAVDLADKESVSRAASTLQSLDGIVHLAAYIPPDTNKNVSADAEKTLHENVQGTVNLLQCLSGSSRLQYVLFASSFEVYGEPKYLPVDEKHPTEPLSYYGASKLTSEKYLDLFARHRSLPHCTFRLPAIYGPGDQLSRAIGNFIRGAARGDSLTIYGDGTDKRELVYAGDAAKGIVDALQQRLPGVFNIGSGTGYSISDMACAVQSLVPKCIVETMARTKPKFDYVLDIHKVGAELGWKPTTSLQDGIKAQLQWEVSRIARIQGMSN